MELLSHQVCQERPNSAAAYVRHRPETTLLYQIVQEYWPEFQAELASHGKHLPAYVTKEFDEYLKCGRLEHDTHTPLHSALDVSWSVCADISQD